MQILALATKPLIISGVKLLITIEFNIKVSSCTNVTKRRKDLTYTFV